MRSMVIVGLAAALGLTSCSSTPVQVALDPSLATGEAYVVKGLTNRHWGKPLSFGPFATRETRVGETWTWTAGAFDLGAGVRGKPFRFVFVGEHGEEWSVECRSKTPILASSNDSGSWSIPIGETRLGCAIRGAGDEVRSLAVGGSAFDIRGQARFGGQTIEIRSLHEVPGKDGKDHRIPFVLGYELRQGDRVLGGVDLIGKGRVVMAQNLEADLRGPVAVTATVLMFFGQG
ncbi:MAG: hypothetical protein ABI609_08120 [Acidobacteriota bacterium]